MRVHAKTVQKTLRHDDIGATLQLYAQSDMELMREAQRKFLEQLWVTGFKCSWREFSEKSWLKSPNRELERSVLGRQVL